MFKNVFLKTLFNLRWHLLGWTIAIVATALLTMAFYTSFNQTGIDQFVNSVPDSLKSLIGTVADFKTIPGFIGQQIFGPNLMILMIIMAVLLFVSVSASEEDRGSMQSLLSFPVSRTSVYFQKWLAVVVVIALVSLSIIVGVWGGLLIVNETANYSRVLQSIFEAWLMCVAYGMVAYALAMGTGKKALTIAVASGYAFMSFLVTSLAPAVDKLEFIDKFSIFHYYNNPQIMQNGLDNKSVWILVAVIVVLTVLGWVGFIKRDIRA